MWVIVVIFDRCWMVLSVDCFVVSSVWVLFDRCMRLVLGVVVLFFLISSLILIEGSSVWKNVLVIGSLVMMMVLWLFMMLVNCVLAGIIDFDVILWGGLFKFLVSVVVMKILRLKWLSVKVMKVFRIYKKVLVKCFCLVMKWEEFCM